MFRCLSACILLLTAACMPSSTAAAPAAGSLKSHSNGDGAFMPVNSKADFGYVEVRPGAHMFWWAHIDLPAVDQQAPRPSPCSDRVSSLHYALGPLKWKLWHACRMLEPCTGCHHMSIFEEPLIIWLQGGPGASSSGYGNFMANAPGFSCQIDACSCSCTASWP
jgi:Serine carboxypeptidase